MPIPSNQIFMSFFVAGWGHAGYGFKYSVKVSQIGKTGFTAYFRNIFIGFHKFSLCIHNSCNVYILNHRAVCMPFKFSA